MNARNGKTYWRSLGELQQTPEFKQFLEREFPTAASEFPEGVSRRRWIQLMGASLALGGLSGCRWEAEQIAPLAVRPENRVPGEPEFFATSIEIGGMPRHLLVTCYDGRPIKVEGNPDHPASCGATDAFSQASLLGLYDPDRSDRLIQRECRRSFTRGWEDLERFVGEHFGVLREREGQGLALLIQPTVSITMQGMLKQFQQEFSQASIFEHSPISRETELAGSKLATGCPLRTRFDLSKAKVIACLDADLLGIHPDVMAHTRAYARGRDPDTQMNRLYVIESQFSVTGAAADHRLPLKSTDIGWLLTHLASRLSGPLQHTSPQDLQPLSEPQEKFVDALADDLLANRGSGLIAVGRSQPAEVHALAHRLNAALANVGKAVVFTREPTCDVATKPLKDLVHEIRAGRIDSLLILGGNPVFDAPGDLQVSDAIKSVATTIHLGVYEDETSRLCTWHLPKAHAYESWGDVRSWDGTISISQPLIAPLLNGKSALEVLALACQDRRDPQLIVRQLISETREGPLSDSAWVQALHDGFIRATALPEEAIIDVPPQQLAAAWTNNHRATDELELVFTPSGSVLDGQFANNGWLQELPGTLTKLTWDNAAIISPATAEQLGIDHETLVRLQVGEEKLEIPAFILPGQAHGSIGVAIGYGRRAAGVIGGSEVRNIAAVGVDVHPLRRSDAIEFTSEFEIVPTGIPYEFATTQDHHAIDTVGLEEQERRVGELVREGTRDEFGQHPDFAQHMIHHNPLESLWNEPTYEGHAWGMSIDLNRCLGCNACVVACQAENNVPVVGKDQVAKGREMHWLRVDRYFKNDVENPQIATQPVACHHCENAPCEQVCPVAATVHSNEGLNDMIYNRCVGTRYCANNCPYKVRRFNFFHYSKPLEQPGRELVQLSVNPEVTVRSRGVMEKCTYCVQRIQKVKIDANSDQRAIRDGEIRTACQQACPAEAIEFGDLNDPNSRVAEAHEDSRAYGMLAELNVKPRTKYLARIRNPHPALAGHASSHEPHGGSVHDHS